MNHKEYMRNYYATNEKYRQYVAIKNKERNIKINTDPILKAKEQKRKNDYKKRVRYSGNREKVLKRDDYKCIVCHEPATSIHHLDGQSYHNSPNPNNRMDNLISVCHHCHIAVFHKNNIKQNLVDRPCWNKDLTKDDPRVAKNLINVRLYNNSIKGKHTGHRAPRRAK